MLLFDIKIRVCLSQRVYTFGNAVVENAKCGLQLVVSGNKLGGFIQLVDKLFKAFGVSRSPFEKFPVVIPFFLAHHRFHPANVQNDICQGISQFMRNEGEDILTSTFLVLSEGDIVKYDQHVGFTRLIFKPGTANLEPTVYTERILEVQLKR